MPKKKKPTLKLKKESLRDLKVQDLDRVRGGAPFASEGVFCALMQ